MATPRNTSGSPPSFKLAPSTLAVAGLFNDMENIIFWIKDREGRYRVVNRNFLVHHGFHEEADVIGKTDFDLSPYYIATQFRMDDEKVLGGQTVRDRIELVGRFDHTAEWCLTNKVSLEDSDVIIGTAGMTKRLADGLASVALDSNESLAIVVDYCRTHLDRSIPNAEMAKLAGLSQRVFERRFRSAFQSSPQKYMRKLRLRLSCHSLVYSQKTLAEIAGMHGFCDQSHYSREFRLETSTSPGEYRESFQSGKRK